MYSFNQIPYHSLDSLRRLVNALGRPLTLTLEPNQAAD